MNLALKFKKCRTTLTKTMFLLNEEHIHLKIGEVEKYDVDVGDQDALVEL